MRALSPEQNYVQLLRDFLAERVTATLLEDGLVDAEWSDDVDQGLKNSLARIRLFLTEAAKEMRPIEELNLEIIRLLAALAASSLTTAISVDFVSGIQEGLSVYNWDSSEYQEVEWPSPAYPETFVVLDYANRPASPEGGLDEIEVLSAAIG